MSPLVSILIPCHNAESWLAQTLESALGQTWPNKEIILVDDGSTDSSLDIARSFEARGVTVIAQGNQGACAARNRGLEEAQGTFTQFLDADDLLAPNKIEVQVQRLRNEPRGTVASAPWERFYETLGDYEPLGKSHVAWRDFEDPVDWLLLPAQSETMMPLHGWLTPRSVVDEAGQWNGNLLMNQDGEYFARVLVEARKIAFCPDAKVYYRTQEGGVSARDSHAKWQSLLKSWRLIYEHVTDKRQGQDVRRTFAALYKCAAYHAYPAYPKISRIAEKRANGLWEVNWEFSDKSFPVRFFVRTLGWKSTRWLQHKYRNIVY